MALLPFMKSRDGKTEFFTDGSFIYARRGKEAYRLDLFDRHYYKLRLFNGVPILEIDGLRMQLVKDFETPLDYAKEVVGGLHIRPGKMARVLDTCMGLGYTAIESAKKAGVGHVTTCEYSEAVIKLAKWNPMSEPLFEKGGKIEVVFGDISELIKTMKPSSFDYIIHDPPRFSLAPQLYSSGFYSELFRVCGPGARIFHYVGSVGKRSGKHIEQGAMKRLMDAEFQRLKYNARLQGIFAER